MINDPISLKDINIKCSVSELFMYEHCFLKIDHKLLGKSNLNIYTSKTENKRKAKIKK